MNSHRVLGPAPSGLKSSVSSSLHRGMAVGMAARLGGAGPCSLQAQQSSAVVCRTAAASNRSSGAAYSLAGATSKIPRSGAVIAAHQQQQLLASRHFLSRSCENQQSIAWARPTGHLQGIGCVVQGCAQAGSPIGQSVAAITAASSAIPGKLSMGLRLLMLHSARFSMHGITRLQ